MKETMEKKEVGIICKKDMDVSYPKKKNSGWFACLMELVLIVLISGTAIVSFADGCGIKINQQMYWLAEVLLSVLFYISFLQKKWKGLLLFGEAVAYGAAGYYFQREISDGLAYVVNTICHQLEKYFDIELVKYQVNNPDKVFVTTIILIYISVFLVGFVAYIIRNELSALLLLPATIWIAFIPEVVGQVPKTGYRLCYFAGILIYGGSNLYKRKSTERKFSAQKRIQGKVRLFQGISVGICFGIFTLLLGEGTYKELTKDKSFKMALQENMRRGFNTLVRGTLYQGSVSGGIDFGELGKAGEIEYTGDVKLKLRLGKKDFEPVYLRGYVGSYYQDNAWVGLPEEKEAEKQWLEARSDIKVEDYHSALLYYYLALTKVPYESNELPEVTSIPAYKGEEKEELIRQLFPEFLSQVEIDNIAESYGTLFVPYFASANVLEKNGKLSIEGKKNQSYYDWDVVEEGKKNANFTSNLTSVDNHICEEFVSHMEDMIESVEQEFGKKLEDFSGGEPEQEIRIQILKDFKQFHNYQQLYEDYIYRTYLQVPDELNQKLQNTLSNAKKEWGFQGGIQKDWIAGLDMEGEGKEWKKLVSNLLLVKEYLAKHTSYTLKPGVVPEGQDFVTYFLYENKKGFCTHYASSATLMLRSLGIPARYVEGYMAGSTALKVGKYENDFLTVELTDENAHAWVEVYISNYGWVPVEMTPGYSEGFEVKEAVQQEEEPTSTPTEPTSAPQTSVPSQPKEQVQIKIPIIEKIKNIILAIIFVVFLLFAIWIRRFILCRYRNKKEMQPDFVRRVIFYYKEIDRILCIKKHKEKEEPLREWLQREREDVVEGIDEGCWRELFEIGNKCAFSNQSPSLDEVEKCRQLYQNLLQNSYKTGKRGKKIFYKYIKVM